MDQSKIQEFLRFTSGLPAEIIEQLADLAGIGLINMHLPTGDISLNRPIAQFTGYEPGEVPHSADTKQALTYEDDWPMVAHAMGQLMSGERDMYQLEYRMRRRDGSLVSVSETSLVYERDKQGRPLRLAGLATDLSRLRWAEQKARDMEKENRHIARQTSQGELAEENRILRATNAAAGMLIGGFHQDYEAVLRQALQLLGESIQADRAYIWRNELVNGRLCCYQRSEWARETASLGMTQEVRLAYDDFYPGWRTTVERDDALLARKEELDEALRALPGMADVRALMILPLFLHGDFWGFIGFDDCAAGRGFSALEADTMRSGALVIASSISRWETFHKLSQAREEAMASTQAKGEFLSRMSHEIRTPMNAIIGMTAIAQKSDDPEKVHYCLNKIEASSRQLLGIINDVLDMSKIDANKFEITPAPFDFEKMLQNVVNVVQVKLDEKRIHLTLDLREAFAREIISDELRLSQVLINLLTNAIKFTPENGRITLRIRREMVGGQSAQLRVAVIDTGIGIAKEQQKRLFHSFVQADGGITRQYGGTGLGLAISKKIVTLMGGDIWVESEPGQGSTFQFDVMVDVGGALKQSGLTGEDDRPARVLVVDDSPEDLLYLCTILREYGIRCDEAEGGAAALSLVRRHVEEGDPYDIILLDWRMPDMDGGETARAIHALHGQDATVVMVSGYDWSEVEEDAKKSGIRRFLTKPVLPGALYRTVQEVMASRRNEGEEAPPQEAPAIDWHTKTLLIVEDVEINREILQSLLEPTGIHIITAGDGVEALAAFSRDPEGIDAILMDVQMPNMDGLEATRRIRAMDMEKARRVPIIAMTANAFKEDAQRCFAAGMDSHLAKPLDVQAFLDTLSSFFGGIS